MPQPGRGPLELAGEWRAASDRKAIVKACREMYANDPRGEAVIATLARDIVRGGFEVEVHEAAGAQAERAVQIADDLTSAARPGAAPGRLGAADACGTAIRSSSCRWTRA